MTIDLSNLSPHQRKALDAFDVANKDISISILYRRIYGRPEPNKAVRILQQRIAPTFAAINDKIGPARIEPGELKRTYRLNTKG